MYNNHVQLYNNNVQCTTIMYNCTTIKQYTFKNIALLKIVHFLVHFFTLFICQGKEEILCTATSRNRRPGKKTRETDDQGSKGTVIHCTIVLYTGTVWYYTLCTIFQTFWRTVPSISTFKQEPGDRNNSSKLFFDVSFVAGQEGKQQHKPNTHTTTNTVRRQQ